MSDARPFFPGIHALRALAATFVVIEHAAYVANDYSIPNLIPHLSYGRVGVILFFAISGFVIALQRDKQPGLFVAHRLLRIYPSYWIAIVLAAAMAAAMHQPVAIGLSSILLYPSTAGASTLWIPYWTLAFEMVFYALAAAAFALRGSDRTLTVFAVLWIVAVNLFAANPASPTEYEFPGPAILLSAAVQVFPIGLLCGIHFDRLRRAGRWPYLLGAAIAFAASIPLAQLSVLKILLLGISSAGVIVAVADLDIRSRLVKSLGDASYGIYLMHFPAMLFAAAVAPALGFAGFFIVGMTIGVAFGFCDHRLYRHLTALLPDRQKRSISESAA